MKDLERYYLKKLINKEKLKEGVQYKKEIRIVEECIIESTMDMIF